MTGERGVLAGCAVAIAALGLAACGGGGGGSGTMKLGAVASLERPGLSTKTFKTFKYKTAVINVKQAGPNDLKGLTLLGNTNKNDIAFYVTQRVSGVQAQYSGWSPQSPDVFDGAGVQATPLVTGTDVPQCVEHKPPAGFGPGQSFETCSIYLLPPSEHVGKVVLAAEGPGQNDLTWKIS
jgi:hypothetical protein